MTYWIVPPCVTTPNSQLGSSRCWPALPTTPASKIAGQGRPARGHGHDQKQGGYVRANTTRAVPSPSKDGSYLLTGHKWFCSAPMCDLFLVLAQTDSGLTCFLLPASCPAGKETAMRLQRLKDKLGNRSNASAEVEYDEAMAWPVGDLGAGVRTIIEMVSSTRLDCILGSAAAIRQACREAIHHASYRQVFGATLADQPAMTAVLADLALESEAATTLAIRLAGAADRAADGDRPESLLLRLLLPAAKHWICKRTPAVIAKALECLVATGSSRNRCCRACTGTRR